MTNPPILMQLSDGQWESCKSIDLFHSSHSKWFTLDYKDESNLLSIFDSLPLSETQRNALVDPEIRPRLLVTSDEKILLFIRGINLNPESEPEDMVSIRIYFDQNHLLCFRSRRLQTISETRQFLEKNPTELPNLQLLFTHLLREILFRIEKQVTSLANKLDDLEDAVDSGENIDFEKVENIRRTSAKLWRYLSPQKDVLEKLTRVSVSWLNTETKHQLQELEDEMIYEVEELALVRERCQQLENLLSNKLSQRVNKNLYLISVITAIFIPVSFLTGLLGINVGGMPGVEANSAFWWVCSVLLIIAIIEIIYLKVKGWF
ncbi:CorA family divalent cation transporter [Pleionea sediminis]|uniref:CorA family divalent cation transporter n=1 Tax=Pleionea sediminis TaxID=2569479 RepID=UPI0011871DCB|nr:CorA family divalent cation transporter [Pleionea sediminis]